MSDLVTLTILSLIGGTVLAVLMFVTAARVEGAAKTSGQALEVAVGKVTLKTSNVVAALGVLALAAMVGVPSYFLYVNSKIDDRPMELAFRLKPPTGQPLQVARDDRCVVRAAYLQLYKTRDPQVFTVTDAPYDPVNIRVKYDWTGRRPLVSVNGSDEVPIKDFDGTSGTLPVIELTQQTIAPQNSAGATLTRPAAVPATQRGLTDPPAIANDPATVRAAAVR